MGRISQNCDVMISSDRVWTAAGTLTLIKYVDQMREISQILNCRNVNIIGVSQWDSATDWQFGISEAVPQHSTVTTAASTFHDTQQIPVIVETLFLEFNPQTLIYFIFKQNLKESGYWEHTDIDGRILLQVRKWTFKGDTEARSNIAAVEKQ